MSFARWCRRLGMGPAETSRRIGLRPETLSRWQAAWSENHLRVKDRGRPIACVDREQRRQILACLI